MPGSSFCPAPAAQPVHWTRRRRRPPSTTRWTPSTGPRSESNSGRAHSPGFGRDYYARERTPDWAYGAIVYDSPKNPDNPPYMVAIASKLTGDVDPAKILEYAPGQLNGLSEFAPLYEPKSDSVSGFQAVNYAGTYVRQGQPRVIGQQTIVVPGQDILFVLQLNADAPRGEEQPALDAVNLIDEKAVITLPS